MRLIYGVYMSQEIMHVRDRESIAMGIHLFANCDKIDHYIELADEFAYEEKKMLINAICPFINASPARKEQFDNK